MSGPDTFAKSAVTDRISYDDVAENIGFMAFAPAVPARGPMFGAATRSEKEFEEPSAP